MVTKSLLLIGRVSGSLSLLNVRRSVLPFLSQGHNPPILHLLLSDKLARGRYLKAVAYLAASIGTESYRWWVDYLLLMPAALSRITSNRSINEINLEWMGLMEE